MLISPSSDPDVIKVIPDLACLLLAHPAAAETTSKPVRSTASCRGFELPPEIMVSSSIDLKNANPGKRF
jgi:hypothetical protein